MYIIWRRIRSDEIKMSSGNSMKFKGGVAYDGN